MWRNCMSPYNVVLAEDHVMFRQGIKQILEEDNEIQVVGEVSDGLELLDFLKEETPDMVILDISMPRLPGVEAARRISMLYPAVKVLILSMHKDKEYLSRAISAGVAGYLPKEGTDSELISAVKKIRKGETYISPLISDR